MFVIFFDVDGVLNKKSDWTNKYSIDKDCVKIFGDIVKHYRKYYTEIRLIICSTWRAGLTNNCTGLDSSQIINLQDALKSIGLLISDKTPVSNKSRQEEIEYYIRRNSISDYLVVDDDKSLYPNADKINLYCPDYLTGLTKKDYKNIRKYF